MPAFRDLPFVSIVMNLPAPRAPRGPRCLRHPSPSGRLCLVLTVSVVSFDQTVGPALSSAVMGSRQPHLPFRIAAPTPRAQPPPTATASPISKAAPRSPPRGRLARHEKGAVWEDWPGFLARILRIKEIQTAQTAQRKCPSEPPMNCNRGTITKVRKHDKPRTRLATLFQPILVYRKAAS
jgi:hypothetical protein